MDKRGGLEVSSPHLGQMTKMATMPIYEKKKLQNIFLQNQRANGPAAWYTALGTWAK